MAARPPARSHREGTLPQTPPAESVSTAVTRTNTNDNTEAPPIPQQDAILRATRDVITQELQHITRTIYETNEETRHHIDQVQRQVDVVRRSWDEHSRNSGRVRSVSDLDNTIRPRAIVNYQASPTRSRHSDTILPASQQQYDWQDAVEPERDSRRVRYTDERQSSQPPLHWSDNIADAITRRQQPREIDLEHFLTARRRPMLTEQDMERFSRKPPEKLTESQIRGFAHQLERYLTHNRDNIEFVEEGDALRTVMQYINYKTLGMWLQMYANPDINFRYSKCEFWRRKRDENAQYCMPYPTQKIDIMESLDQIARGMQGSNETRDNTYSRSRNQYNNNNSNQYYSQSRNRYDNQTRIMTMTAIIQIETIDIKIQSSQTNNNQRQRRESYDNDQQLQQPQYQQLPPAYPHPQNQQQERRQSNYDNRNYQNRNNDQRYTNNDNRNYRSRDNDQRRNNDDNRNYRSRDNEQRRNSYDNRDYRPRDNDQRRRDNDRRNSNLRQNNVEELQDIQQEIQEITSTDDYPFLESQYDADPQDQQDFQ